MANGKLGSKVVTSRDAELVYTVPADRTATMNINVLNASDTASDVSVYVSDETYQDYDFQSYDPTATPVWATSLTFPTPLTLIGTGQDTLLTGLKTTPVKPETANSPSTPMVPKEITFSAGAITIADLTLTGDPLPTFRDNSGTGEVLVRSPRTGSVYALDAYLNDDAELTASQFYGMTAGDNVCWATNEEGPFALFYVGGEPGGAGSVVNSIADYRSTAATYNTSFSWGLGQITKIAGVKTTEERFLVGTSTGFVYISNDGTPETQAEFSSNSLSPISGVGGYMIGAVAIGDDTSGNLLIAYSNNKVAYASYGVATPADADNTNYSHFDFPAGVTFEDVIDVTKDGNFFVLVTSDSTRHKTADLGLSWTTEKHIPAMPIEVSVSGNAFIFDGIAHGELVLRQGREYHFYQFDASNRPSDDLKRPIFKGAAGAELGGVTYQRFDPANGWVDLTPAAYDAGDYTLSRVKLVTPATPGDFTIEADGIAATTHKIMVEDTAAPHDDATLYATFTQRVATGDATKKVDLFSNGEVWTREKRFHDLDDTHLIEKTSIPPGGVIERTGIVCGQSEQIIVTTDGTDIVVRCHGIEE